MFAKILKMAAAKIKLSIGEQIDRAKDGRTQTSIIEKMKERGIEIDDSKFSRKKLSRLEDVFTQEELKVLSEILGTTIEG